MGTVKVQPVAKTMQDGDSESPASGGGEGQDDDSDGNDGCDQVCFTDTLLVCMIYKLHSRCAFLHTRSTKFVLFVFAL